MEQPRSGVILVVLALLLAGQILAADLRVPAGHPSVASALAVAANGDRIVLAPGVYQEHDLDLRPGVTLLGDPADPATVVIDAGGQGRVMRAESLDAPVLLSGLTLTGGHAAGANAYERSGGGLFVSRSEVRLESCRLTGNRAHGSGGGLRVADGNVVMIDCEVRDNVAGEGGGGMDVSYGATGNTMQTDFAGNTAAWGGGISVRAGSSSYVTSARIVGNEALAPPGLGGALAGDRDASPFLKQTVVAENSARYGGAVYAATAATPSFAFVTVDRNDASVGGAAFHLKGATADLERTIVSFHAQPAFAMDAAAAVTAVRCDLFGNEGGDWTGPLADLMKRDGNICADPLYCAPGARTIREDSPCAPEQNGEGLIGARGAGCQAPADTPPAAPGSLEAGAFPNPFNPRTRIVYALPSAGHVRVSIHDLRGRRVDVLVNEPRAAGEHRLSWDARDAAGRGLASGTYLLVVESGGRRATSKLVLVR